MRTPSSQKCRLDLAPPLADRFISGFPIDYGPVLLLMPFGFRLTADTLPSEVQQAMASGRSWLYPAFAFVPVWTSPYLPLSPASEATNPASWIWRPSFERQRDFNPPEQRAAQRTLPARRRPDNWRRNYRDVVYAFSRQLEMRASRSHTVVHTKLRS